MVSTSRGLSLPERLCREKRQRKASDSYCNLVLTIRYTFEFCNESRSSLSTYSYFLIFEIDHRRICDVKIGESWRRLFGVERMGDLLQSTIGISRNDSIPTP